jgi:hypothetical protein
MLRVLAKFRRLYSALLALSVVGGALVASPTAANAVYVTPQIAPTNTYTVGDAVYIDFNCKQSNPDEVVANSNDQSTFIAPPGTFLDGNMFLTGTLTEVGPHDLGVIRCYTDGVDEYPNVTYNGAGTLTVRPTVTPAPRLQVHDLNTGNCDVLVTAVLPANPDPGSLALVLEDTDILNPSQAFIILADVPAGELISFEINLMDLSATLDTTPFAVSVLGMNDMCGSTLKYSLGYSTLGAPVGVAEETLTVDISYKEPRIVIAEVLDKACTLRITARPNFTPQDGVFHFLFSEIPGIGQSPVASFIVRLQVDPNSSNGTSFEVDMNDLEKLLEDNDVRSFTTTQIGNCADVQVTVSTSTPASDQDFSFYSFGETNVGSVARPGCDAGYFGKIVQEDGDFTRRCFPAAPGHYVPEENVLAEQIPCDRGSFASDAGSTQCMPAPAGTFVPVAGAVTFFECPRGGYNAVEGQPFCQVAPKGFYTDTERATAPTKCPGTQTTALEGARSQYECYTLKTQTAKALKLPSVLKVGAKLFTVVTADTGLVLNSTAKGACTLKPVNVMVKIKGKSVKQARFLITASKTAGLCKVEFVNTGDVLYKPLKITKTIKVTKTGK